MKKGMSCCEDPACSHALVAAATKEAVYLTDKEREIILGVLGRDERLRRDQQTRVIKNNAVHENFIIMSAITACLSSEEKGHLKAELQNLRRKGALRPSTDWDSTGPDPDRCCGRCRCELGRVINRGAYCRACRLKVCKGCREYSFRTTDWVCTVCHKHMEIQAASGEWMNEFVRRPSRRRDNRVYVPAADIIKRTIRRSWTISNPTPRWSALRGSPELRPYNSLPRGQDINNYPTLQMYQTNLKNIETRKRSPARRTQSEDVYNETKTDLQLNKDSLMKEKEENARRQVRVNPLMSLSENKQDNKNRKTSPKRKTQKNNETNEKNVNNSENVELKISPKKNDKINNTTEKRVSFDSNVENKSLNVFRTKSLNDGTKQTRLKCFGGVHSLPEQQSNNDNVEEIGTTSAEIHHGKEETTVELCDIEPLSGTVFRKVTVRRRRQENMRKMPAVDTGWRRDSDLLDILLPDGDDYKLVFISSDSSSKEEDIDDNDSSSTASSFPIDECDWDYFEPGTTSTSTTTRTTVLNWSSPFGSPHVYRRSVIESPIGSPKQRDSNDDDRLLLDSASSVSSHEEPSLVELVGNERNMDETLQCVHQPTETQQQQQQLEDQQQQQRPPCQSCGAPTQFIPIPVPVPIPFPVPALWTTDTALKLYNNNSRICIMPRNFWSHMNHQLITSLLNNNTAIQNLFLSTNNNNSSERVHNDGNNASTSISTDRNNTSQTTTTTTTQQATADVLKQPTNTNIKLDTKQELSNICEEDELHGFLECEQNFDSSSDESSNDDDDNDENNPNHQPLCRVYIINGGDRRESDDALPSSNVTTDGEEEEEGRLSPREDDMSSSGSADTDSDDTGTVADQKPKRFSRIFVVNKNLSSSSSTKNSSSSETDTSDNDTDTERDCTVILTKIKKFTDEEETSENGCDRNSETKNNNKISKTTEYVLSSSPGLSDVSAESLNSSDVDNIIETKSNKTTICNNNIEQEQHILVEDDEPSEWNSGAEIRSSEPVNVEGDQSMVDTLHDDGEQQAGAPVVSSSESDTSLSSRHGARYTSLVMITQEPAPSYQQVSVVTTDTTTLVPNNDVIVQHTNWQKENNNDDDDESANDNQNHAGESVTVITGGETLSAFEEGLADDDSWVENLSHDDEDEDDDDDDDDDDEDDFDTSSGEEVTLTCSAAIDQEDELRGYHRAAIDFTLHTIVEESCEDSEVEQTVPKKKDRPASATDLEKYFFFGLGDGNNEQLSAQQRDDVFSETSSIYSEGMDSLGPSEDQQQNNDNSDPAELASSRLEKYFLSGFMGFTTERRDSDGSVGSDSEGRPSPEQRRKRLVRARGTGRSHSSSLDNLLSNPDLSEPNNEQQNVSEDSSSSDSEVCDELNSFEKSDGQFDTVKRKKCKKQQKQDESKSLETTQEVNENCEESDEEDDGHKTPQPESSNLTTTKNQQSRDSGFVGSCDDLLSQRDNNTPELPIISEVKPEPVQQEKKFEEKCAAPPPSTSLSRKDSFNNWSSDEETNLMMCKMRQFFKTMVANSQCSSKPTTPTLNLKQLPSPRAKRCKPPQLVYFENELTRLMKTVPGIRDDQVREIVEYLSSEDTWSDSYDSSDYTSSDLEGTTTKSALQQQISDSCKQIINKFDTTVEDEEGDEGDGGILDESRGLNRETAFVYQKLVASFGKMASGDEPTIKTPTTPHNSPPLIAKVMHHIGSRLVALMHEVSSGESHASNSPKTRHYHRRLQQKISSASTTTTEDDDSTSDSNLQDLASFDDNLTPYNLLPRSRSHDLLVGEQRTLNQSSSGVSDIIEEREASDCERFSWRGSFESALLATDSRNKLSLLGGEGSASASALAIAAKRRSAGDLLFSHKSLSREQLDRVRSCGSIGGGGSNSEDKLWTTARPNRRRSSVPDASCGSGGSADGEDEDEEIESRATLPRSLLQSGTATTNSLPRLPTNTPTNVMLKAQSMYHFLPQNAKSARYRPPGFNRLITTVPKRAVSAPGLQPTHQRRGRRSQQHVPSDDVSISEAHSSPMLASRNGSKSASPSPVAPNSRRTTGTKQEWQNNDDDIDRLVVLHHQRSSLSSLGLRSDSMASVYSGAGEGRYGTVTVRGQIEFGLQYNYKASALEILIKQCKDLAPVDVKRNRSDPYVKVYLLPDKSKSGKRKTKVKKHTLNPVFDECLKFHISLNGLETRTLWLTVWHSDMFGRNDFLGEVMMALENKVFDDPTPQWYTLQERTEPFDDMLSFKGDIIVCLKFVPPDMTVHKKGKRSRGALHVLVKEAKSLTAVKANGTSDPFCKSYLLPDKGRSSKQKTPVIKRTINPVWNHTFVYDDVTLQELAERSLELTVWDHDRLASNEFLGGVRFSLGTGKHYGKPVEWMDATGKELSLWKSMLEKPNFWVEGCLALRPSLDARAS